MNKITLWIKNLVSNEFNNKPDEGWCGEIAGEIYKYLGGKGHAEIWGLVVVDDAKYFKNKYGGKTITNISKKDYEDLMDGVKGNIFHSFVKQGYKYWDGTGSTTLGRMVSKHIGKSDYFLVREDTV
jgi:hypothetical protein